MDESPGSTFSSASGLDGVVPTTARAHVLRCSDVQRMQLMVAGVPRGGALAVAFSGRHPRVFNGVVKFAGGWIGGGCENVNQINPVLFRKDATSASPSLW